MYMNCRIVHQAGDVDSCAKLERVCQVFLEGQASRYNNAKVQFMVADEFIAIE